MGLKLYVNNEEVWESEGDTALVSSISGSTARGEFGRLGVANDIDRVDLFISVRDPIESSTDLDIRERNFRNQNSEELEKRIASEGQTADPANTLHNEALEESRNPTQSEDSSGDETTETLDGATSTTPEGESSTYSETAIDEDNTLNPINTSSSGGSSDVSGETVSGETTSTETVPTEENTNPYTEDTSGNASETPGLGKTGGSLRIP